MLRFVIISIFLFAGGLASPLVGQNHCTWGPSYWCQHLDSAKECGAVGHCMSVWRFNKPNPAGLTGEKCTFCQNFIKDIRNFVKSGKTVEEITQLARMGCGLIKSDDLRLICSFASTKYLTEILQMIGQNLHPSQICSAIGFCSGYKQLSRHQPERPRQSLVRVPLKSVRQILPNKLPLTLKFTNTTCQECLKVIGEVQNILKKNGTEQEVENLLKQEICANLGPLKDQCDQVVAQYVPIIIQLLVQELDPNTVCKFIGLCTQRSSPQQVIKAQNAFLKLVYARQILKPMPKPKVGPSAECEVCELIVTEARTLIAKNATQAEVEEFLRDRLCAHLGAWKAKCDAYVTEFGPMIFQLIISELDPTTICQAIGACGKSVRPALRPALRSAPQPTPKKLRASVQCIMCEMVIREVDKMLLNNRTTQAIEAALLKVCSILPSTIKTECDDFVREYGPAVIKLLEQELNPKIICTLLGLCTGAKERRPRPTVLRFQPGVTNAAGTTMCDECKLVVSMAVALLKEQKTEEEIEKVLEKVCNFLPTSDRPTCDAIVKQYTPELLQLLATELNPTQVCQAIKLCTAAKTRRYDGRVHFLRTPAK